MSEDATDEAPVDTPVYTGTFTRRYQIETDETVAIAAPALVADAAKPSPYDQAELETLREFYQAWERLHAVPKDSLHRKQCEEAAQNLVAHAHILRRMYV